MDRVGLFCTGPSPTASFDGDFQRLSRLVNARESIICGSRAIRCAESAGRDLEPPVSIRRILGYVQCCGCGWLWQLIVFGQHGHGH